MILTTLQMLAFAVGLAAYYCAAFMYEDEQGDLQNRVERLWVAINDKKKLSGGNASAIFNKVASVVQRVFDRIYGKSLISAQLVGVSVCYALAGLCLGVAAFFTWMRVQLLHLSQLPSNLSPTIIPNLSLAAKGLWIVGAVLLLLGVLPALKRSVVTTALSLGPAALIVLISVKAAFASGGIAKLIGLDFGLILSLLCDVGLIVVVRLTLKWLVRESRIPKIFAAIVMQIAVVALLILLPYELGGSLAIRFKESGAVQGFVVLGIFNLFTALAASLFLLTLVFVLLHRAFWPFIDRLTYPVAARQVLANSAIMGTVGTACLGASSPWIWHVLKAIGAGVLKEFLGQ